MKRTKGRRNDLQAYLYLLPAVAVLGPFLFLPVVQSFVYSFYQWDGLSAKIGVGFANFVQLLSDERFWNSLKLTLIWVAMSGVILAASGLVLSISVEHGIRSPRLGGVIRTVLFLPMMMSLVSVGLLWSLIFNPTLGMLNSLLIAVHLIGNNNLVDYLGNPTLALYFAFVPAVWQWSGFGMVIFSAAIQGIPRDMYDAASIDGCSTWAQIRRITLPLVYPTVVVVMTIHVIGGFKAFDLLYVMTNGGPANSTEVSAIYIFKKAFLESYFGYSSAIAVVLFVITMILTIVLMRYRNRVTIG